MGRMQDAIHRFYCDTLGTTVTLPRQPRRIVSLLSSATEALFEMGLRDRLAGISEYCPRYIPAEGIPIVGDYLRADTETLRGLKPDLVLLTGGIQRQFARNLHAAGLPVVVIPLPNSTHAILDNFLRLGALVGELQAARTLVARLQGIERQLAANTPSVRPRAYAELWLGRHLRMAGGYGFINDLMHLAGADNCLDGETDPYPAFDAARVEAARPDTWILFQEPEYPVDAATLAARRGWTGRHLATRVIASDVSRGRNLIHDGPSLWKTALWLQARLQHR